jgi:mono/diheme cytochrome c family protein
VKHKLLISFLVLGLLSITTLFGTSTISTWVKDMYNQPNIKPQQKNSINQFPSQVVSTSGIEYKLVPKPLAAKPIDFSTYQAPENDIKGYQFSAEEGERLFYTYCAVCHGADGQLNQGEGTKISLKGLKIAKLRILPIGYYVERMQRGGIQMPPMAYRMSKMERWHIANYIPDHLSRLKPGKNK